MAVFIFEFELGNEEKLFVSFEEQPRIIF